MTRPLASSNATNVTSGGRDHAAEKWLRSMGGRHSNRSWKKDVPPFFSPPPSQNKVDKIMASQEDEEDIQAHVVDTASQLTATTPLDLIDKENRPDEEEHREVTTSFRTYIDNQGKVADEESTGETFSAAKKPSLEDGGKVPTLEAHSLATSVNLYSGLSPRLGAAEEDSGDRRLDMAPHITAHEVSHATHLNLEEEKRGERGRTTPNPEPKAKQAVRSFAPLDLSRIEISDTTAPRPRHGGHESGGAQSSVTKKIRRTERTISRVQERLQEAERRAREVPELEEKVAALKRQLKETKKWKDEAVIYKRMAAALQSKVRHTEASALHSHSVVLENMARAFEIQEQNDLLDSYPIASQVQSHMHSQFNSPLLSRNNSMPTTSQRRASQNQGLCRRNKQFLDEYLSAEEQEVGWCAIFQETYDRVDRKMREYDARLNLGVICGALGLSVGIGSLVWSSLTSAKRRSKMAK